MVKFLFFWQKTIKTVTKTRKNENTKVYYLFSCLRSFVLLPATRLPTPETALSLCAGISGNGGQVATYASIEAVCRARRWQAGSW